MINRDNIQGGAYADIHEDIHSLCGNTPEQHPSDTLSHNNSKDISAMDVLAQTDTSRIRRYRLHTRKKRSGSIARDMVGDTRIRGTRRNDMLPNDSMSSDADTDAYVEHEWQKHKCPDIKQLSCKCCGVLKTDDAPSCRKYKTVVLIRKQA